MTTAAPEVSETVVEWTATEVDAFVDKQTYGAYITVSGSLAISGNYYNLTVEGASKGVVSLAYLNSSLRSKVSSGKSYKITGYAVYLSGGKLLMFSQQLLKKLLLVAILVAILAVMLKLQLKEQKKHLHGQLTLEHLITMF